MAYEYHIHAYIQSSIPVEPDVAGMPQDSHPFPSESQNVNRDDTVLNRMCHPHPDLAGKSRLPVNLLQIY